MQAAEAELFKSRGAVINVSSICSLKTANDDMMFMGYHAAKAAQDKITEVVPVHLHAFLLPDLNIWHAFTPYVCSSRGAVVRIAALR